MKVILYSKKNDSMERLMNAINTVVDRKKVEIFNSVYSFAKRASGFFQEAVVFILMPATKEELLTVNSIYELAFNPNPIILVLPDRNKETANMGFKLRPRFVEYADGNFMNLSAVLNKIIINTG